MTIKENIKLLREETARAEMMGCCQEYIESLNNAADILEDFDKRKITEFVALLHEIYNELEEETWDLGILISEMDEKVIDRADVDRIIVRKIEKLEGGENDRESIEQVEKPIS